MLLAALCCAAPAEPAANRTALFLELAAAQDTAQRSVAPEPPAPDRGWVGSVVGLTAVLGQPELLSVYKDPNGAFVGWGYPSVIRDAGASAYQMMYQGGVKGPGRHPVLRTRAPNTRTGGRAPAVSTAHGPVGSAFM